METKYSRGVKSREKFWDIFFLLNRSSQSNFLFNVQTSVSFRLLLKINQIAMSSAGFGDNILESTPPSIEKADEVDLSILNMILQDETLTEEQVAQLYGDWLSVYQKKLERRRAMELQKEDEHLPVILCKLKRGVELTAAEKSLFERRGHKIAAIKETNIEVEAVDILADIVNGDYTLQDVHTVREGVDAAGEKDDLDNSPLQLFDKIVEAVKDQTHDALNTNDTEHFFANFATELNNIMMSTQLTDAVNQAATAIDLVQKGPFETNEAKEACESFIKAMAMNEAEQKLKQAEKLSNENQSRRQTEKPEPVPPVNDEEANPEQDAEPEKRSSKSLDFDVSELNFEISYLPSDDPDVYKPLEIISYIGMTKNVWNCRVFEK